MRLPLSIAINRKAANLVRSLVDEWLPPVVREHWPFPWVTKLWLGRGCHTDFKDHAFRMTDGTYAAAYRAIGGLNRHRGADITEAQAEWAVQRVGPGRQVLEIGPGQGFLTNRIIRHGYIVTTLDLSAPDSSQEGRPIVGVAERLPFRSKSFDTTVACMVLEHVRSLTGTLLEIERVTRQRVLFITPRQRYYRITFDYHLHFFYSLDHLASHLHIGNSEGQVLDGDLCLLWHLAPSRA